MQPIFVADVQKFKKHSQFSNIKDFNNNIEQWMAQYKQHFTPSELIALKRLIRYSADVYGVATARINKILEAIKEKDAVHGVSRSTFKRMLTKAKKIGLIEVKEMVRKNYSQSSNLYIFQRFTTNEPPRTEAEQAEIAIEKQEIVEQLNHPKTSNLFKTNKQYKRSSEMDHTYLPDFIDSSFITTTKNFLSAVEIYELWLRVKCAYKNSKLNKPLSEVMDGINKAFKQTVFLYKQGAIKKSFTGYFYALVYNYFYYECVLDARSNNIKSGLFYDWLNNDVPSS